MACDSMASGIKRKMSQSVVIYGRGHETPVRHSGLVTDEQMIETNQKKPDDNVMLEQDTRKTVDDSVISDIPSNKTELTNSDTSINKLSHWDKFVRLLKKVRGMTSESRTSFHQFNKRAGFSFWRKVGICLFIKWHVPDIILMLITAQLYFKFNISSSYNTRPNTSYIHISMINKPLSGTGCISFPKLNHLCKYLMLNCVTNFS